MINAMNQKFNTIETIRTNSDIKNKSIAYLAACDEFEKQSIQFIHNENFVSRKSAEEVSLAYENAKKADGEYNIYAAANACEIWLKKAWNNAD
jgi:hypothetical protein